MRRRGQPDRLGGLDVLAMHDVGRHAAGHARDLRHPGERDERHDQRRGASPSIDTNRSTSTICGKARMTSIERIRPSSRRDRLKPASMPSAGAEPDAERGCRERHPDDAAPAPEQAREHVVAEVVRAQREVARRRLERDADECGRVVRRDERPDRARRARWPPSRRCRCACGRSAARARSSAS